MRIHTHKIRIHPTAGFEYRTKNSDEDTIKFVKEGIQINAKPNPDKDWDVVSQDLVNELEQRFPSIVSYYMNSAEDNLASLELIACYRDVEVPLFFEAWLDNGETIGEPLQSGLDIEIGRKTIGRIRMARRRRAFLNESMTCYPTFKGRRFELDLDQVFVLMPFTEDWSDHIWRRHIKPVVESLDLKCIRADDFFSPTVIIEDVWKAINTSNIIIADLTGRNANVFYELGIAHVIGAPVILLSQDHETPAFDTAHWRQIRYQDNSDGCELLEEQLKKALESILDEEDYP